MSRRFATLYNDSSMSVHKDGAGLDYARHMMRYDGEDAEMVEVEIKIVNTFGNPHLQKVTEHSALCPTCQTEVFIEVPDEKNSLIHKPRPSLLNRWKKLKP